MNNPRLYNSANELQRRDVNLVLSQYMDLLSWKPGARVLDIGCGDGSLTTKILLPYLPQDLELLVAGDISLDMIRFAAETHNHPKVKFIHLDIEQKMMTNDLYHPGFDTIFSFYCLHWVVDQRLAFNNISRLLKPGGEALVVFVTKSKLHNVHLRFLEEGKWQTYLKDAKLCTPEYHNSSDPEADFNAFLKETDMSLLSCQVNERIHQFSSMGHLKDAVESISPFIDKIPIELRQEYMEDTITQLFEAQNSSETDIVFHYEIMVAHLKKQE